MTQTGPHAGGAWPGGDAGPEPDQAAGGRILLVDDDPGLRAVFALVLRQGGYVVLEAGHADQALEFMGAPGPDLIFCDMLLPGVSGMELLERFVSLDPLLPVVMVTGRPSLESAMRAVRRGAYDYVGKPVEPEDLLRMAQRALRHGRLLRSEARLRRELHRREENIRALLNAITESMLLVSREGEVIYANAVAARRLGLEQEELAGRRVESLGMDSEVLAGRLARAEQAYATGRPVRFEDRHGGRDYVLSYYPVRGENGSQDRLAVFAQDVTAARRAEQERERAEQERERVRRDVQAVFHSIPEAIFTVDRELVIRRVNDAAVQWPGNPGLERGRRLGETAHLLARTCADLAYYTLRTGRALREYRVEVPGADFTGRVALVNISPLEDENGQGLGAVLTVRDITRLTTLEERLGEQAGPEGMVGSCPAMLEVYERIDQLARVDSTVLVTGESGTGKELAAGAIHARSPRSGGPLVKVNCAGLSEGLLEAELFGHVRGAFTGAVRDRVGRVEAARGGTLLLDEVGDVSPRMQQQLLRFLENREYEPVGDSATRQADVRVVAATNADLPARVAEGRFRADLYYRLKVVEVRLPPLRERLEDLPALALAFARRFAQSFGKNIPGLDESALRLLRAYSWPGNVRELRHAVEHACVVCSHGPIRAEHLPRELLVGRSSRKEARETDGDDARRKVVRALERARWNKAKTARALGVSRGTLYNWLKKYDIKT